MRNNEIDKILSIIDNLFGEDDNAALPSNWEMSVGRGVGDQHMMARPEYTCINIEAQSTVTTSEIELLEEMLAELNQDGLVPSPTSGVNATSSSSRLTVSATANSPTAVARNASPTGSATTSTPLSGHTATAPTALASTRRSNPQ
jgi:hypothetical protein